MIRRFFVFALSLSISSISYSEEQTFQIDIGAYLWQSQYSGTFTIIDYEVSPGDSLTILQPTDVEDDLNMEEETQHSFYLTIEHNKAMLPNVRFAHTTMQAQSTSILSKDILFNGLVFHFNDEVESEVDLSHTDLSLYYPVISNKFFLNLGLTLRQFDGFAQMRQSNNGVAGTSRIEVNEIVPLAYGNFMLELPINGLNLDASLHFINYDGNEVIDFTTAVNYQTKSGFGTSLGYRSVSTDLEDLQNQAVDLRADGPYIALTYQF